MIQRRVTSFTYCSASFIRLSYPVLSKKKKKSSMSSCDTAGILPLEIRSIYTACSIPSLLEIRGSDKTENLKIFRLEVRTSLQKCL